MQLLESRRSGSRRRRWVKPVIIACCVALGIAGWLGWEKGRAHYLHWKKERALAQARTFIEKHDAANAQLALEVAIKTIPGDPETLRVAAELLEQVGSPDAMRFRRSVVQILPESAEDIARLIYSCLNFRDLNAARDALSSASPKVSNEVPMLQAALAFALATDNGPVADALFTRLRDISPESEGLLRAQAALRLRHPKEEQRLAARRQLEELARHNPSLALPINREFAADALQRRDYTELKLRQKLILASPGATFTDHLQKANVDLLVDHVPFDTVFSQLAPRAMTNETDAAQFAQWLLVQSHAKEVDQWLSQLPGSLREKTELKSAAADALAQLGDWDRLNALLAAGAWGPIPTETLRLAFAAQTVDSPARPSLRKETWDMALESCGANLSALRVLQRLAAAWHWDGETERTLWTIARAFPMQTWSHQLLFNLYKQNKDIKGMREVMSVLREADRTVPRYQHDWALLTLLTDPTSNWTPAKDTMRSLYEREPGNATYATGYSFALAQSGRGAEALAIVQKLSDLERNYGPRQPYLAFVYGVAKKGPELEQTTVHAAGTEFLPAESYLFVRAREELNRKPENAKKTPAASPASTAKS